MSGTIQDSEYLIRELQRLRGVLCTGCGCPLDGEQVLIGIALGFKNAPRCMPCLAAALDGEPVALRENVLSYIRQRECYSAAWDWAKLHSAERGDRSPFVLPPGEAADPVQTPESKWDAGELGCGELVLELRLRLEQLAPGAIFHLIAADPGAPEDLPAWCRLTGHALVRRDGANYWIRRKI